MKTQESAEMYLETILVLSRRNPTVRSIDIAGELDYKKSSVSVAMKHLREHGDIIMEQDGFITLTDQGRKTAEAVYERHVWISDWLIGLGVDKAIAVEDACRMEHVISPESFAAMKRHMEETKKSRMPEKDICSSVQDGDLKSAL